MFVPAVVVLAVVHYLNHSLYLLMLSTYLHGLAGDLAATDLTQESLIATDLIDYLPRAFRHLHESSVKPKEVASH